MRAAWFLASLFVRSSDRAESGAWPTGRRATSCSCQFCGLGVQSWQEPIHVDGVDHDAFWRSACVLCGLPLGLDRPTIAREALLIVLPEMTQAALNVIVREAHLVLRGHGEPLSLDLVPSSGRPRPRAAHSCLMALRARGADALARIGTTSPRDLGAALQRFSHWPEARRLEFLAGVRFMPLGRFYRDGEDIYPALLDDLAASRKSGAASRRECGGGGTR